MVCSLNSKSVPQFTPAHKILKKYFGYDEFRKGQLEIVNSIIDNQNTLAIRSTGSGKSICFQVPALYFSGLTLVISPLISLMTDQVDALEKINIPAAFINSSLSQKQTREVMDKLLDNKYKLIYLSPEKLGSAKFAKFLYQLDISFIAIDEAHCISMWGHDFRPSYKKIPLFIDQLKNKPTIAAFTATATAEIQDDIIKSLHLKNPTIFKQSSLRTNLCLNVISCFSRAEKQLALIKLLKQYKNYAGIVYCSTRKSTQMMANLINYLNIRQQLTNSKAEAYHGGLESQQRAEIQNNFLHNKTKIICATNAFGMGVDKSDIRFVIHYQVPANIENYYQEVGRAGRDGHDSACFLLFCQEDVLIQQKLLNNKSQQRYQVESNKLKKMIEIATKGNCLQLQLAEYFGEQLNYTCGVCGFCTNFHLNLSQKESIIWQQIKQHELLSRLPFQTQYYIALLAPKSGEEWELIPGIGRGILQQLKFP
jgi:ATP-dependent DNA helicase RecQ